MLNIPDEDSFTENEVELSSEADNTYNRVEHISESEDNDYIDEAAADIVKDEPVKISEDDFPIDDVSEEDISEYDKSEFDMFKEDISEKDMSEKDMSEEYTPENDMYDDDISDDDDMSDKAYPKKGFIKEIIHDLIFYAVIVFVCLYIIPNFVLQRTVVDGPSMMNTLQDKDQLYVEKLSYHFDALKRFDIIVFYPYGRSSDDYYVKRIIGLPGEKVQIIGENIYINDELLEEDYGLEPIRNPGRAAAPVYLADDEYFVMGDNRNVSKDSRSTEVGNVKKANIGGRVILRIYPFDRFGFVD